MLILRALLIAAFGLLCKNLTLAQELQVDVAAVRTLVSKWNEAHTVSSVENLSSLYSDSVNFYGSILKRSKCISIKRDMLAKQKDFSQVIKNELFLSGYSSGSIRCDFVKTVSRNNTAVDYKSYLIIKRFAGNYIIVGESDLITDGNIRNEPDLGSKVAIINNTGHENEDTHESAISDIILLGGSLVVGAVGLLIAFRRWQKPDVAKRSQGIAKGLQHAENYERGLKFEKFIVEQFHLNFGYFTLLDWRSDKFHHGIFPESNRNPDLVYKFKHYDFDRTFSVECKYRRKAFNGSIQLMNENKYKIYEAFHRDEMPVYIVLGLGGKPDKPAELYLIPFQNVKLEMHYSELSKYRKSGTFFYDIGIDRLT